MASLPLRLPDRRVTARGNHSFNRDPRPGPIDRGVTFETLARDLALLAVEDRHNFSKPSVSVSAAICRIFADGIIWSEFRARPCLDPYKIHQGGHDAWQD